MAHARAMKMAFVLWGRQFWRLPHCRKLEATMNPMVALLPSPHCKGGDMLMIWLLPLVYFRRIGLT